jgi:CheY-like chemotaxis protein
VIGDAPEKLKGKRLLVVDDIDINREIVTTLLGGSGAIIETAKNGQEAVMAYMEAEPYTYDLIFMDMLMPVMNGINATKVIRGSDKVDASSIKIIAMTANVMPGDMESAYAVGMNDYLAKPVELITMYGMLEKWL